MGTKNNVWMVSMKTNKNYIDIPAISDIELASGTTGRLLEEIHAEEPEEEEDLHDITDIEVIPINLSVCIKAPIDAVAEQQKLYVITRNIISLLMKTSKPGKPNPQLLGYIREAGQQLEKIYKMTEGVQKEESLEKLKVVQTMLANNPVLDEELRIQLIKRFHQRNATGVVSK